MSRFKTMGPDAELTTPTSSSPGMSVDVPEPPPGICCILVPVPTAYVPGLVEPPLDVIPPFAEFLWVPLPGWVQSQKKEKINKLVISILDCMMSPKNSNPNALLSVERAGTLWNIEKTVYYWRDSLREDDLEVQIIFPSSACQKKLLTKSIRDLEDVGFDVKFRIPKAHPQFPFLASTLGSRISELNSVLLSKSDAPILCARGGYGASDLLSHIPWGKLKTAQPKWIVGFSDISALQSALYSKLGWPSIHAPMPGTEFWGKHGRKDLLSLFKLLRNPKRLEGTIKLKPLSKQKLQTKEGWLFGGCMSVLSNLIGTPYFPHSLRGAILFLEDTGEHPGRILRMFNQFTDSGILQNAVALILGNFGDVEFLEPLHKEIAKRSPIPVYTSNDFGHISPNFPLVLGANGVISAKGLYWSYDV